MQQYRNFLTNKECQELIQMIDANHTRSSVVEGGTDRTAISDYRTSSTCNDGSVEFLAEGELKEVESFIENIDSKMKGYWTQKSVDKREGVPHFQDFSIRY